ncbi:MAG: Holliday junction resolvase RuvX [Planctomycetota bacterium]
MNKPLDKTIDQASATPDGADDANPFPMTGRIAAVDYGTVRIGIAICDPDRILASPVEVYEVRNEQKDAAYFKQLAATERARGWVVGLPIHCDGGESDKSREARSFARWLADQTRLPVRLFDERFSTAAAKERLRGRKVTRQKQKKQLDAVAALVLLESFLEACRYHDRLAGQSIDDQPNGGDSLEKKRLRTLSRFSKNRFQQVLESTISFLSASRSFVNTPVGTNRTNTAGNFGIRQSDIAGNDLILSGGWRFQDLGLANSGDHVQSLVVNSGSPRRTQAVPPGVTIQCQSDAV